MSLRCIRHGFFGLFSGEGSLKVVPENTCGDQFPAIPAIFVEDPGCSFPGAEDPNTFVFEAVHAISPFVARQRVSVRQGGFFEIPPRLVLFFVLFTVDTIPRQSVGGFELIDFRTDHPVSLRHFLIRLAGETD